MREEADVNVPEPDEGFTPLMYGATYNDGAVINSLLRSPLLNLNSQNRFGMTALMLAINVGATDAACLLIDQPVTLLNTKALSGVTAFLLAIKKGNERVAEKLLAQKRCIPTHTEYRKAVRKSLKEHWGVVLGCLMKRTACEITEDERRQVRTVTDVDNGCQHRVSQNVF